MWPTPQARDYRSPDLPASGNFQRKIAQWFTNRFELSGIMADASGAGQQERNAAAVSNQPGYAAGAILRDGQPDPDNPSTDGKSRALLNPRWVAQLQGFLSDWLDGIEWLFEGARQCHRAASCGSYRAGDYGGVTK